jgi:hypothetical protein
MAEFKPMVKMQTTEPSVVLKLKKGGTVKKADGGFMPMTAPSPLANKNSKMMKRPMVKAPMRPGMPAPAMKEGGRADMMQDKAMIKKAFKQHDAQEHMGGKGTDLKLKKGGMMKKATGGVVKGQGGYATGGVVKGQGGYATGGVVDGQGGYKKGGAAKKPFATGGAVKSGSAVAMPEGKKKPSSPVAINYLSGTFKKGGKVEC